MGKRTGLKREIKNIGKKMKKRLERWEKQRKSGSEK